MKQLLDSLTSEIASLKLQLMKKEARISNLDVILNQVMETHGARVREYEDLKGLLKDVIRLLRKKISHADILEYLKIKDSNEFYFRKLW